MAIRSSSGAWRAVGVVTLTLTATLYVAVPNARPDFSRFNCHDSESYLALAYGLSHGLGYTRSMIPGAYVGHTWWPPLMPLILAPSVAGSGPINWIAVKGTVIAISFVGIWLVFGVLRRLTPRGSPAPHIGAVLVATNPFYWDFSHQAMAEVPLTVWVLAGVWLIDHAWAPERPRVGAVAAAGLFCGAGILVKAHALGLALAPIAYVIGTRPWSLKLSKVVLLGCFLGAFAVPSLLWLARNASVTSVGLDGSKQASMTVTQTKAPGAVSAGFILTNIRQYAVYDLSAEVIPVLWPDRALTWSHSGWLALLLAGAILVLAWIPERGLVAIYLTALPMMGINLAYDSGGGARYWVPISILLTLTLAVRLAGVLAQSRAGARWFAMLCVVLLANLAAYVVHHERQPYETRAPWRELAEFFAEPALRGIDTIGVLTPNFHAFQLMTAKPAPMPTIALDRAYDYMVARVDGPGPQPPAGSVLVLRHLPWALYRLPSPMSRTALLGPGDFSSGIRVEPYTAPR
jgi:Dolichyl-phosphate-mannose-protein mannosyltransferase